MSTVQIYYLYSDRLKKSLSKINFDAIVNKGDMSLDELYNQIKKLPDFCRGEESIDYSYFLNLIASDINLYAVLDGNIAGVLSFMFNIKDGFNIINFNGICSPSKYSGQGVGQELIHTLIKIGKLNNIQYISLDCKGKIMNYYHDKFGFEIVSSHVSYEDDDDDSDEEDSTKPKELYYLMRLNLSNVSGGKKKRHKKGSNRKRTNRKRTNRKRTNRKVKKNCSTRKKN
jgi:predicted GNAT family acetyltransferase